MQANALWRSPPSFSCKPPVFVKVKRGLHPHNSGFILSSGLIMRKISERRAPGRDKHKAELRVASLQDLCLVNPTAYTAPSPLFDQRSSAGGKDKVFRDLTQGYPGLLLFITALKT